MRSRFWLVLSIVAIFSLLAGVAIGQNVNPLYTIVDANGNDPFRPDAAFPLTIDTIPTTTTTTEPPTTTTTEPPTTTTTLPPTTTTTTTTTTMPEPELVIPDTQPYELGVRLNDGFNFIVNCTEKFGDDCPPGPNGKMTELSYMGHGMPYLYSEAVPGNHDHAWWEDGDREGYGCAYAFLYDKKPDPFGGPVLHPDGHFIARATVVAPPGAAYGQIIDRYMAEGVRFYSGEEVIPSEGREIQSEDCEDVALDDFDYEGHVPRGPDEIRVGLFRADGEIADIRDFTALPVKSLAHHFEFLSWDGQRVTVLLVLHDVPGLGDKVSHVFYYDVMNDGQIAVEVNGQIVPAQAPAP